MVWKTELIKQQEHMFLHQGFNMSEEESDVEIIIRFNRNKHEDDINELSRKLIQQEIKCNDFELNISTDACRPLKDYPDDLEDLDD